MATRLPRSASSPASMPPQSLEWTIASDLHAIERIVDGVSAQCAAAGFSSRQCRFNIPIALTEALSNAIMRGNESDVTRSVRVRADVQLARDGATLVVDVTDEGKGFDLGTAGGSPDAPDWLEREDGRGLFLMRSLMDRVECLRPSGFPGHTVRLTLRRA